VKGTARAKSRRIMFKATLIRRERVSCVVIPFVPGRPLATDGHLAAEEVVCGDYSLDQGLNSGRFCTKHLFSGSVGQQQQLSLPVSCLFFRHTRALGKL
jgi:hypothetical protein